MTQEVLKGDYKDAFRWGVNRGNGSSKERKRAVQSRKSKLYPPSKF